MEEDKKKNPLRMFLVWSCCHGNPSLWIHISIRWIDPLNKADGWFWAYLQRIPYLMCRLSENIADSFFVYSERAEEQ
jgi:hypothetical protein